MNRLHQAVFPPPNKRPGPEASSGGKAVGSYSRGRWFGRHSLRDLFSLRFYDASVPSRDYRPQRAIKMLRCRDFSIALQSIFSNSILEKFDIVFSPAQFSPITLLDSTFFSKGKQTFSFVALSVGV